MKTRWIGRQRNRQENMLQKRSSGNVRQKRDAQYRLGSLCILGTFCAVCVMTGSLISPLSVYAEEDAAARMEQILNEEKTQDIQTEGETETAQAEKTGRFSITPMNTFLRTNDEVNVRSGPDTSYESIGKTEIGQDYMVTGISEDGKWYQVFLNGQEAYIAAEYMEEIPADMQVDAELEEGFVKSGDEIESDLQAAEQAAAEQAAAEQAAAAQEAEQAKVQAEAPHVEKKANYGLIIAVVFIAAFLISLLTLLKKDQQQGEKAEEMLDIIDLEAEATENPEEEDRQPEDSTEAADDSAKQ